MRRFIIVAAYSLLSLAVTIPVSADERHGGYEGRHGYWAYPHDYGRSDGYRYHHHDRGRHYGHFKHHGYRHAYQGHWRSWADWDRYVRKHPALRRHGHYYHHGAHLMFRSCVPDAGTCFFFSIGR